MATCYYPSFDVIRIAANGERIPLLAEDVNVYNVTAAASLGTLTSDADYGIIDSGSFTATLFDVIEISHDTYPGTCRFTLQATADDAFTAVENDISAYIAENLYTDRTESKVARMYIVDLDNASRQPEYAAEIKPGVESKIHIPQTSTAQNLRLALVSESIEGQFSTSDIQTAAEYFDITIPATTTYQPLDATLTALAGQNWAANSLAVGSGSDTVAQVTFAANTFPARSSSGNLVAKTITDFGLSLIDDADAAAARTTLGLVIGTNVQAYDADLTTWAGITPGTGVATALAVNVGTAGSFVVNGGALGTPSSGTLTNCTFPTLNQNTTGSAATLTTTRTIWGQNFNGSANVSGTLALGVSDLTLTGSIGATGARATKVWTAALESTAMPTVSGTSLSSTFSAIAGSASIVTVGTITSGTWNGTDIAVADGGTGRSTSTTAYGLIAAGTTATGAHQTLAAGLTTQILVGGGASALPTWGTDLPTAVTIGSAYVYRVGGTDVAATDGGTGQSSYAVGDILYASTTTALSKLADVATGNALISGGVGVAPSWGKIALTTHVSGTLPIANGGTNATSFGTTNGAVYYDGTRLVNASTLTVDSSLSIFKTTGGYVGSWPFNASYAFIGSSNFNHASDPGKYALIQSNAGQTILNSATGYALNFRINNADIAAVIASGLIIGGTTNARSTTEGTSQLVIYNGTAPVGTLTNGASFYAAAGEMRVMDSAGNSTLLSPHDKDGNWIHSEINYKGRVLRVDMERLVKAIDKLLGGGFVQEFLIDK